MLNLANILTLSRIALIVPLIGLMLHPSAWAMWSALVLYIFIAATDWFDGLIARRYNQISEFGRFLDPVADKILVAAMFIALTANDVINGLWLALPIIIMTREFLISGLREFLGPKKITVHVSKLAKWKTTTQMLALGFLIPAQTYINAGICGLLLLLLATALTVITGWGYMKAARGNF